MDKERNKAALAKLGAVESKKAPPGSVHLGDDPDKALSTLEQLREYARAQQSNEAVRWEGPPPQTTESHSSGPEQEQRLYNHPNNVRQPRSFDRDMRPDQLASNIRGQAKDRTVNPDEILHPKMTEKQAAALATLEKMMGSTGMPRGLGGTRGIPGQEAVNRGKVFGKPVGEYETPLAPEQEAGYLAWKQKNAPHDSGYDYDNRGAYLAGAQQDEATGHGTDLFKKPNHESFSNESMYATGSNRDKAGSWSQSDGSFVPGKVVTPEQRQFLKSRAAGETQSYSPPPMEQAPVAVRDDETYYDWAKRNGHI